VIDTILATNLHNTSVLPTNSQTLMLT